MLPKGPVSICKRFKLNKGIQLKYQNIKDQKF